MVQGIAYFEKDIGVNPLAAHDFVEVLASVADLMRQPGDASSLPRKLSFDGFPDVKGFDRGLVVVHCSIRFGAPTLFPQGNKKGVRHFVVCLSNSEGSGKPLVLISKKQFTPETQTFRLLILVPLKFTRFFRIENKSVKLSCYILCSFILL